jgi:hypothetical protein
MEEDNMVKSIAIVSYGDKTIRGEGLQARVRDKIPLILAFYLGNF